MSWLQGIQDAIGGFRERTYPKVRNAVSEALLQPGGKGTHESAKEYFHEKGNYAATKKLGGVLPPQIAANLTDAAYLGNETMTGVLAKLAGKPFFSPYGFNWADVGINRRGQDRAMRDLEVERAANDWKRKADLDALLGSSREDGT